jgi:hypothetical protein
MVYVRGCASPLSDEAERALVEDDRHREIAGHGVSVSGPRSNRRPDASALSSSLHSR